MSKRSIIISDGYTYTHKEMMMAKWALARYPELKETVEMYEATFGGFSDDGVLKPYKTELDLVTHASNKRELELIDRLLQSIVDEDLREDVKKVTFLEKKLSDYPAWMQSEIKQEREKLYECYIKEKGLDSILLINK